MVRICSADSTAHGPAATTTSGPPMRTPLPTSTTVPSGRKARLASLYGCVIRTTSRTPSRSSMSRGSTSLRTPTAPRTVWVAPVERCTSNPIATSRSMTCWICSSLEPACITTTMNISVSLRSWFCASRCYPELDKTLAWLLLRVVSFVHGRALHDARFVQDALKQPSDGGVRQGSLIGALHTFQHLARALGQQLDQLAVDLVNLTAPVVNRHGRASRRLRPWLAACLSERTRAATAEAASSTEAARSISSTSTEPTTAASARPPRIET